jgi:hypothetical protein
MKIDNLYIGDINSAFAQKVKQIDPSAVLITKNNLFKLDHVLTAYTCIGDLEKYAWTVEFKNMLDSSNNITYIPSSDIDTNDELTDNDHTKLLLENYRITTGRNIAGLEEFVNKYSASFLNLHNQRHSDNKQIWIAGCSNTNGIGYVDIGERYGDLLSAELNLPATFLSKNGSSISWVADQILRADIHSGDIVFWGITHNSRLTYHARDTLLHINPYSIDKKIPISRLDNFDLLYHNVKSIHQVIKKCQQQNIKLFMLDILPNPLLKPFLYKLENYDVGVEYYGKFIDFGKDGEHAGPEQHKIFAKKFLTMYNNNL